MIIVEGKRDKKALQVLGIRGKIIILNVKNQRLIDRAEQIIQENVKSEVLILFDFDKAGIELTRRLTKYLEAKRVRVRQDLRIKLRRNIKDLRCIEELIRIQRKIEAWEI